MSPRREPGRLRVALIAVVVFCVLAPGLGRLQFGDPIENLNVATAMEIRRTGNWLLPTLQEVPRLAKPPMMAWLTALFLRQATLDQLSSTDPAVRSSALNQLALQARLPALLSMCLMLVVVGEMGGIIGGARLGVVATIVGGSTFLFLRQSRIATTDAPLALWVALGNLGLAEVVFLRRHWRGCMVAGLAIGLALMTKGPVCLLQTVLPFGVFLLWQRVIDDAGSASIANVPLLRLTTRTNVTAPHTAIRFIADVVPFFIAVAIALVIGTAWYAYAASKVPGAKGLWFAEATRIGADGRAPRTGWYFYLAGLWLFLPWLVWLVAGTVLAAVGRNADRLRLPLCMLVVPIVVMSFSRDRYERYLTPMVGGGALVAAGGLCAALRKTGPQSDIATDCGTASGDATSSALQHQSRSRSQYIESVLGHSPLLHSVLLTLLLLGYLVAGRFGLGSFHLASGANWLTTSDVVRISLLCGAIIAIGCFNTRPKQLVGTTLIVVLVAQFGFINRLARSTSSQSTLRPIADLIHARYPNTELYAYRPTGRNIISVPANDMAIHLNRTVRLISDPESIAPSVRPQIYMVYRTVAPGEPPMSPPTGWTLLARPTTAGKEDRCVFLRVPG